MVHSCFREKFGIPRQAGLAPDAEARIEIFHPFDRDEAFRKLSTFSHIWVVFVFHERKTDQWKPTVRPPRLGGNARIGVFATRSGFRPNPIGMSAVELVRIARENKTLFLDVKGVDLLDKTPVLDIKPYLPYADCIDGAADGFAPEPETQLITVDFSPEADLAVETLKNKIPRIRQLIVQVLQNDPRPAYYDGRNEDRLFGFHIHDVDVKWRVENNRAIVVAITSFAHD